ncbi:MAG: preprotein translocase subunit SecA [Rhodospirillales bacterium]|jgi:preprotein translocase subunit SecA|nr:preprotein translocase subunit SecA [Rhodospirillales bacterium]MBT4006579.1 preprotein translocase subunit SecA [Rhodospirillales bacterium]MBT5076009.1 preprotein translocase subunit SecA [Rhodospirillales bacterium]MBT5113857.1 preprotein translocase subunit SecA [Rhodospirillales bacterium]MBT5672385.1 preprotein translocase subunit SecA [Rhodospirillales bacterium]
MLATLARRFFGNQNDRFLRPFEPKVAAINALEPELEKLSAEELAARTDMFRNRLSDGETLDDILVEAFATVREAAKRTLGQRHFDVQLLGGMVLNSGAISEMATGEGKTLVSTLPVYLNALEGKGVHVVTVNDYLAKRDSEWMGEIYAYLGLTVGCITNDLEDDDRRAAYAADVTYGTNNEFGFDYLRDNMKFSLDEMVQSPFNFAIVDEVDSILIDEARTPLIISGQVEDSSELYVQANKFIPLLDATHFEMDEKAKAVTLTEGGSEFMEKTLTDAGLLQGNNLYDIENIGLVHHINQALRAHKLFQLDRDYIVHESKIVIIDEFTGRMMEGRRYSEGLHQALEAKENCPIESENQTLASITFQNYFRMYPKLAGMTGTAMTEAAEFEDIYKLEVINIPTNVPCTRIDHEDEVYRTADEKVEAILEQIKDCHARKQPILVGTVSIEKSEHLAECLKKLKTPHKVLNARYHEQEAMIISQAGHPGAVTIATNMAGRGTDIQLGGNLDMRLANELEKITDDTKRAEKEKAIREEVTAGRKIAYDAGGLFVIASERHEARRIDNQLRGRSGRQGDPGASKFFLSLEDDLMRIFGSERMDSMLGRLGLEEGEAITHPWVSKALLKAQEKVEAHNFDIRKNLLRFDDVMNDQRKVIYEQRIELMSAEDVSETIADMRHEVTDSMVSRAIPERAYPEEWDIPMLHEEVLRVLALDLPLTDWAKEEGIADEEIRARLIDAGNRKMAEKAAHYTPDVMRMAEKSILLQILDQTWKDHLLSLDHLRQGINLRSYAQRDPLNEYKSEAFSLFEQMLVQLRENVTQTLSHLELSFDNPENMDLMPAPMLQSDMYETRFDPTMNLDEEDEGNDALIDGPAPQTVRHASGDALDPTNPVTWGKVSRNAPCPCGSGKKYKHCHGQLV